TARFTTLSSISPKNALTSPTVNQRGARGFMVTDESATKLEPRGRGRQMRRAARKSFRTVGLHCESQLSGIGGPVKTRLQKAAKKATRMASQATRAASDFTDAASKSISAAVKK